MAKEYNEVIMDGSFDLIRGFVTGFFLGKGIERRPFFHLASGTIRHDTLMGSLKSLLDMKNPVPFCLEASLLPAFEAAAEIAHRRLGLSILAVKPITGASFDFKYEIHNRELGEQCKQLFATPPEGARIMGYHPLEEMHDEESGVGYKSVLHPYTLVGSGKVEGELEAVTDFFFALRSCPCHHLIECRHMELALAE